MKKLIPPDKKQCQAEKPNGYSFMTLGGVPGYIRCTNKPVVIMKEKKAASDGLTGSMAVCSECLASAKKQLGDNFFTVEKIKRRN